MNAPDTSPHALVDFAALALIPTNEQRMVVALEKIVELLTPPKPVTAVEVPKNAVSLKPGGVTKVRK